MILSLRISWLSKNSFRLFHTSIVPQAQPKHRLFLQVDWEKVDAGMYAVVDPVSPGRILYLTEQDYIIQIRVALTNNRTLKVLAAPGESPDPNSSQNSPPHPFIEELLMGRQTSRKSGRSRVQYLFHSPFIGERSKTDGEYDSMIQVTSKNAGTWATKWHDLLSWWSRGYKMSTVAAAERSTFSRRCSHLWRSNGVNFLITYLKISLFVVNTFIGGKLLYNTSKLGRRIKLTNGLPCIVPLYARNGIRAGNKHYVHIWTSVLNAYKGIKGIWGKPEWGTIIAPHPDFSANQDFVWFKQFAPLFWTLIRKFVRDLTPDLKLKELFFTSRAGPNHPNAVLGAGRDAWVWFYRTSESGTDRNLILEWFDMIGEVRLKKIFRHAAKRYEITSNMLSHVFTGSTKSNPQHRKMLSNAFGLDRVTSAENEQDGGKSFKAILGRLHCLYEAAGKIRVVAIVDYWTNLVLKPLHDWMFSILSKIPSDATFDQEGRLREFASRGYEVVYSVDLSSATDLIPLELYRALFAPILGDSVTELWLDLLVKRRFHTPKEFGLAEGAFIHYGTGQPMGALSSWSSMAMVHHSLVQFAAWRVELDLMGSKRPPADSFWEFFAKRSEWFLDYMVLGDDLVIAHEQVALKYIEVATSLGIKIGLHKSYISKLGFFNFANQSYLGKTNVSPLSFKEMVGVDSLARRAEIALRAVRRGWIDVTSTKWLAPLLKLFVSEALFDHIRKDLVKGRNHPVVNWILSVLLVPGSHKFASSLLPRASIKSYLATLSRKASIWSKPIQDLDNLINEWVHWSEIVSVLVSSTDTVYKDFLQARTDLKGFHAWMEANLSIDVEELLIIVFHDQVAKRLADWETSYRMKLKELQVTLKLPAIQPHTFEWGSGMKLDEVALLLAESSAALPRVPDYTSLDYDALVGEGSASGYHGELTGFARLSAMVNAAEHLHSHATPGFLLPSSSDLFVNPNPSKKSL